MYCRYSHWLPLVTRCPKSIWPDWGYVTVDSSSFVELYALRKMIFAFSWKQIFVEDLVKELRTQIIQEFPTLGWVKVTYRLLGRTLRVEVGGE